MAIRTDPLVSIIVPVYITSPAHAELLDETLRTAGTQTYGRCEIIVVDDGSTYDLSPITARHRSTRLVRQKNAGVAVARNTGIKASTGEFLIFLDGDDHLLPVAVATGVAQLQARPHCGFAVGPHEEMTFDGEPVPWEVPPPPPDASRIYNALLGFDWYIIPPSSAIFRREVVQEVGGFRDPWGADDLDFYLRVAHRYDACCYSSPPVTRYRRYSASSSRDGERMLHSMRAVYARQQEVVRGDRDAEAAFARGQAQLTTIFIDCLIENVADRVRARQWRRALRSAALLAWEDPRLFVSAIAGGRLTSS